MCINTNRRPRGFQKPSGFGLARSAIILAALAISCASAMDELLNGNGNAEAENGSPTNSSAASDVTKCGIEVTGSNIPGVNGFYHRTDGDERITAFENALVHKISRIDDQKKTYYLSDDGKHMIFLQTFSANISLCETKKEFQWNISPTSKMPYLRVYYYLDGELPYDSLYTMNLETVCDRPTESGWQSGSGYTIPQLKHVNLPEMVEKATAAAATAEAATDGMTMDEYYEWKYGRRRLTDAARKIMAPLTGGCPVLTAMHKNA